MLRVGARHAAGVATWMVGVRTLAELTVPTALAAAADAQRPPPRILASLPFLLTADRAAAVETADSEFALYAKLPAYRSMFERERATRPSDIAVIGTEGQLVAAVARLADLGVTDLQVTPFGDAEQRRRTVELLAVR